MKVKFPRMLQQRIEQALIEGELEIDCILTLDDLAHQFQASVDQTRQVILAAQRKGLMAGVDGTLDSVRILGLPTTEYASVFTHTASSGLKPRSEVRRVEVEPATPLVAEKLRVEAGSDVYRYVRTRWVNEEALANQTNYMPYEICPGLEDDDVTRYSFQKLLEEKYYAVLTKMQEDYRLELATEQDKAVLGMDQKSSVLVVDRIALSASGWPLVWADIRICPDRFDYVAALWPQAAELLNP